jgi:phenylacetate-CoA ligase
MPLFRYRTGDLGLLDTLPCDCGLPFPRLRQVSGRVHELITLEGIGQVATYVILNSLERLAWLRNFQIAKTNRGIRVYLLLEPHGTLEGLCDVQSTIWHSNRMGKYRLDFEIVSQLVVSPRGKFRYVIDDPGLSPGRRVLVETEMGEIADAAGWMGE